MLGFRCFLNLLNRIICKTNFLYSGKERRKIKHRLSELKSYVKMFWYYEQMDRDMGTSTLSDEQCLHLILCAKHSINEIENQLKEEILS